LHWQMKKIMSAALICREDCVCRWKVISAAQNSQRGLSPQSENCVHCTDLQRESSLQMENSVCRSKFTERIMSAERKLCLPH
jgi:hypothetical protein